MIVEHTLAHSQNRGWPRPEWCLVHPGEHVINVARQHVEPHGRFLCCGDDAPLLFNMPEATEWRATENV